jgi:hypothetical protein
MDEVDPRAGRAPPGLVVQHPQAAGADRGGRGVHVGDGVRDLLQAGAVAVQELGDRRVGVQRREQLQAVGADADREHCLADALLLVDLGMDAPQAEDLLVKIDRRVEIGHRHTDVVDAQHARQAVHRHAG